MPHSTTPFGITYPDINDAISWYVFQTMANNVDTGLLAVDRIAIATGVLQTDTDLTTANKRVAMLNTSPYITPVHTTNGIYVSGGSLLIREGWSVLLFGVLSGQDFAPGQNVGFDMYYGSSVSSTSTNSIVSGGVAGASANGFLNAVVPPVILPAQASTRYAFIGARSTGGGGKLRGSNSYAGANNTVLVAIGLKTS